MQMTAAGYGSLEYFMSLPIDELMEIAKEVIRIAKEQRVRTGDKNRRRS